MESKNKYWLTPKELEVLQRLAMGDTYKMVSENCGITMGTVNYHIVNIYQKLQVNSKTSAVIKAMREKLVSVSSHIFIWYLNDIQIFV